MSPSSEELTDTNAVRPTGEEELEAGVRNAERMMNPQKPSRGEVEDHNKHHLPYRSWCRHCVRGRGVEEAHRRQAEEPKIPEIHLDFMFIGEERGGQEVDGVGGEREKLEDANGFSCSLEIDRYICSKTSSCIHARGWLRVHRHHDQDGQ